MRYWKGILWRVVTKKIKMITRLQITIWLFRWWNQVTYPLKNKALAEITFFKQLLSLFVSKISVLLSRLFIINLFIRALIHCILIFKLTQYCLVKTINLTNFSFLLHPNEIQRILKIYKMFWKIKTIKFHNYRSKLKS